MFKKLKRLILITKNLGILIMIFIREITFGSDDISTDVSGYNHAQDCEPKVNPSTGLPMLSGGGGVDPGGNPFGSSK